MGDRIVEVALGCLVALLSAAGVVFVRKPVHIAVALLVHSLALAGLYFLLAAEMVAMGQLVVYSGAIVVLFLFVVLLLPQGGKETAPGAGRIVAALLAGSLLVLPLVFVLATVTGASHAAAPDGSAKAVGRTLFGSQLVPFELTAVLLLIAIVGAVTLWRRQYGERG